jgi:hypothetical protein
VREFEQLRAKKKKRRNTCHELALLSVILYMDAVFKFYGFANFQNALCLLWYYFIARTGSSRAHQHDELVYQSVETVQYSGEKDSVKVAVHRRINANIKRNV